jgi:hypothetical protein
VALVTTRRAHGVLVRETPRSVLLSIPGNSDVLVLDGKAAEIWLALAAPSPDDDLVGPELNGLRDAGAIVSD